MEAEGTFRTFDSGAVRDTAVKKPMLQLISPHLPFCLGEWLRFACQDRKPEPYPSRNWEKGMPFSETVGSLERHIQKFKMGSTEEDHLAAMAFGCMALIHYREEIKAGRMDPSIDDMPHYLSRPANEGLLGVTHDQLDELGATALEGLASSLGTDSEKIRLGPVEHTVIPARDFVKDNQRTFYLTGPMRGLPMLNAPAFDEARKRGEKMGYRILNPIQMDRDEGIDPANPPENTPEHVIAIFMRDIKVVMTQLITERGDGVALLPNWGASVGVGVELSLARLRGLRVLDARYFGPLSSTDILNQMAIWKTAIHRFLLDAHYKMGVE